MWHSHSRLACRLFTRCLLALTFLFGMAAAELRAGQFEFLEEGNFVGWNAIPLGLDSQTGCAAPANCAISGNPGDWMGIHLDLSTQSVTEGITFLKLDSIYEPAATGSISSLDFSVDLIHLFGEQQMQPNPSLIQLRLIQADMMGGTSHNYVSSLWQYMPAASESWETFSMLGLQPADFSAQSGGPGLDFSASGAPIRVALSISQIRTVVTQPPTPVGAPIGSHPSLSGVDNFRILLEISSETIFIRGDANQDGNVDIADAVGILAFLFLSQVFSCEGALDVNDDDAVNIADAVTLLAYSFSGGNPPPQPFPSCGVDATSGSTDCQTYTAC